MVEVKDIITKEIRKSTDFIFALGYFSESIMAIITIYVLRGDIINILVYILFFIFSGFLNIFFKSLIRDPRPDCATKFLHSEYFSRTRVVYGMPSGHSQNVFYSIVYLFMTSKNSEYWLQIGLIMATLMFYERWRFCNHTLSQLGMGAIVGSIFGFIVVKLRDWVREQYITYSKPQNNDSNEMK